MENFISLALSMIVITWYYINCLRLNFIFTNGKSWFFTILFLSVKYLGGYVYSQRLKHNCINPVSNYWQEKLHKLSIKLNVKQKVVLLESKLIKVPMVIGYIKPVILIPVGLLTGIPHEQIEAILIHELAHIMTTSEGHKQEFWQNFKFLLEQAKAANIYEPVDYKKNPELYCGMDISDNPYYDLK